MRFEALKKNDGSPSWTATTTVFCGFPLSNLPVGADVIPQGPAANV